ncbi:MAG: NADH-quinone oxidoreductase subunit NuoB [Chloroflexi bacterium]|nr:NADH-quinone oxidoreductase subunit NuoB [Chloroflexota bacterium]
MNSFVENCTSQYPDPDKWLDEAIHRNMLLTTVDAAVAWARQRSIFPLIFGTACCAFEMIAASGPSFVLSRFGMDIIRFSPRQADVMMIAGTITWKMATAARMIYDQMPEPKWVIAVGACAISGGTFRESYSVVPGVNRIMPVDVYIPGCPPRPEAMIHGVNRLHAKIVKGTIDNPNLALK